MKKQNEVKLFNNEVFGNVRATMIDDKVWFVGKDVAEALGYKDTVNALKKHCKTEGVAFCPVLTKGGQQQMKVINQRNVIRLIMRSDLPQAEAFQDWVEDEIIPSVLQTGSYNAPQLTREQQLAIALYEGGPAGIEAAKELQQIAYEKAQQEICQDGIITIEELFELIAKEYPQEWRHFIRQPETKYWNRYLRWMKYVKFERYNAKFSQEKETRKSVVPLDKFTRVFVDNGYAIVRTINNKRGKQKIVYTRKVVELIKRPTFKKSFFEYFTEHEPDCIYFPDSNNAYCLDWDSEWK